MTGSANSGERDHERARQVAVDGLILRGLVGSTVHGLSNPGTDDRDEMGVCIEPPEYVIGLQAFEHYVSRTQPEGVPSGPGDLDLTIYGLRKFCRLALKGSPTVLLLFFIEGEHLLARSPAGERLQALAPAFLSKRTGHAFRGYLEAQRRSLLGERHATRSRELSAEHGYDTKYAMHALRIAVQGIELLSTGRISLPVPEPDRGRLRAVRNGSVPLDEVVARLDELTERLERLTDESDLPPAGDQERVDRFLVQAYREAWGLSGSRCTHSAETGEITRASSSTLPPGTFMNPHIKRIHPYVHSTDSQVARSFYAGVFGLEVAIEEPVVALVSSHEPTAQLLIAAHGMETPPPDFGIDVGATAAVDAIHDRVCTAGRRIVYPLTNETWGVRRFFFEDPDGNIVNVLAHIADAE